MELSSWYILSVDVVPTVQNFEYWAGPVIIRPVEVTTPVCGRPSSIFVSIFQASSVDRSRPGVTAVPLPKVG